MKKALIILLMSVSLIFAQSQTTKTEAKAAESAYKITAPNSVLIFKTKDSAPKFCVTDKKTNKSLSVKAVKKAGFNDKTHPILTIAYKTLEGKDATKTFELKKNC